jgi:hypothetical protein
MIQLRVAPYIQGLDCKLTCRLYVGGQIVPLDDHLIADVKQSDLCSKAIVLRFLALERQNLDTGFYELHPEQDLHPNFACLFLRWDNVSRNFILLTVNEFIITYHVVACYHDEDDEEDHSECPERSARWETEIVHIVCWKQPTAEDVVRCGNALEHHGHTIVQIEPYSGPRSGPDFSPVICKESCLHQFITTDEAEARMRSPNGLSGVTALPRVDQQVRSSLITKVGNRARRS